MKVDMHWAKLIFLSFPGWSVPAAEKALKGAKQNCVTIQGVPDTEFLHRRQKEELKGIVLGAGYKFEAADFDGIYDKAASLFEDDLKLASLDAFMYVYSAWINEKVRATQNAL